MKFVVVDTEGTGLFQYRDAAGNSIAADAEGQPRLAALAMIELAEDLSVERERCFYVRPDGWSMTPEATAVNGLTDDLLRANGVPVGEVLDEYATLIDGGHAVAAFNAVHDLKQMRAEFRRAGRPDRFERTPNFCTMRKSNGLIPKASGKKGWPSLREAKAFLIERGRLAEDIPGVPHTPIHDALVCVAILRFLHDEGVDLTPDVHYAKGKPGITPERAHEALRVLKAVPGLEINGRSLPADKAAPDVPLAEQEIPK